MRFREYLPSRILNESSLGFWGLNPKDFIVVMMLYTFLQPVFHFVFSMSMLFPALISLLAFIFLLRIRATQRRHFIRDWMQMKFYQVLKFGVYYDPEDHSDRSR